MPDLQICYIMERVPKLLRLPSVLSHFHQKALIPSLFSNVDLEYLKYKLEINLGLWDPRVDDIPE
jgi:hypothetical protein